MADRSAVGTGVVVLGSWWSDRWKACHRLPARRLTLGYDSLAAPLDSSMHIVAEVIRRNKKVAKW